MNSFRTRGARVEVWRDEAEVAERASELLIGAAREAVTAAEGKFTLALSGGSTPKSLYRLLSTPSKAARVPWEATHVFWSDERCVAPDDAQSNYHMARESLLAHVTVPASQVHRMRGEDEPLRAATAYAAELKECFGAAMPRFSLVLLGMGEDGHTASLFPDSPVLRETESAVAATYVEHLAAHRLTLTLPALNAAALVVFLVTGGAKAAALNAVFESDAIEDGRFPARLVRPSQGELIWLVDESAAALVSSRY